ncbi:hypothetical protein LOZ65_002665 [Ophidiomyces ophidiicola]|nr:hypothetical protein LOZ65_002665 [Ophidiomyces ophidiicola]
MAKTEGVPLSQIWDTMKLTQKLQVLLAVTRLQKQWLNVSFSRHGSLYYAGDVQSPTGTHYVRDGRAVKDSRFAIGPATAWDWVDGGVDRKKQTALARYQQIVDDLIPKDTRITNPCLCHNDLNSGNIYLDPDNPENITGIIDWQSCHISPLFNHNPDPTFLEWDGLEPETLDLVPRLSLSAWASQTALLRFSWIVSASYVERLHYLGQK